MALLYRASAALAAVLVIASLPAFAPGLAAQAAPAPRIATSTDDAALMRLAATLDQWLDRNAPYPRRAATVRIHRIDAAAARRLAGPASRAGLRPRAYYDPETSTIQLIEPWSASDPHDVSVLLHELVHHRQVGAGHWYCPGAQEMPAYRLQQVWLAERGIKARINWIAVVLEAGCVPRDIHPE